ncbi:Chain length determinant protein [Xylanibacter ruminicola]|uniref:Chain length determinant protein n=1 Tax=Xylanibacter ruminicola TaxID=839 RepID=A0A1H4ESQ7_XYLRU|nr:chain-length determining protein [Xylanibacter ruminicola]SEA88093.1 Chain length determinant protein [Xylanibacter ruminicola]
MEQNKLHSQGRKPLPIDFGAIWQAIKKNRKLYYIVLPIAFVVAIVIAKSIPPYFKCEVLLAPESGGGTSMGSLASLASSFGVSLGGGGNAGGDAITPSLYPDLMKSTDFKTSLFPIKVHGKKDKTSITYYDYLKNEWKEPWWEDFFGLMAPEKKKDTLVNNFELTGEQSRIAGMVMKNVVCKIDKKTNLISINVTAQEPYIAALLADSVKTRLQDFLTEYRTQKSRHDLEYAEMLQVQAKKDYEHARQKYVEFVDANQDVVLESIRQKQTDLENDLQLQYNNYNTLCAQVLAYKAKVQEATPAFTTLQRATVPLGPAGPQRNRIIMVCIFMAVVITTLYVLVKEHQLKPLLGLS